MENSLRPLAYLGCKCTLNIFLYVGLKCQRSIRNINLIGFKHLFSYAFEINQTALMSVKWGKKYIDLLKVTIIFFSIDIKIWKFCCC